jgi:hypothetical protein
MASWGLVCDGFMLTCGLLSDGFTAICGLPSDGSMRHWGLFHFFFPLLGGFVEILSVVDVATDLASML